MLRGCGTDPRSTLYRPTLPNNCKFLVMVSTAMKYVYGVGNFCLTVLILLVGVPLLRSYMEGPAMTRSDNTVQSLLDNYGIFWGCVTVSFWGDVILTVHGVFAVKYFLISGAPGFIVSGWLVVALLVWGIFVSLTVAIYYGRKSNFSIPAIFLLPFAVLCCNRAKETSKKIVQCLSIWSLLLFLLHICVRASFVFLALLGRPATVISTTLLYIFALFYLVHLLAVFFTIAKSKKKQKWRTKVSSAVYELAQALAFLVLFATAVCFGTLIGFAGILANYRTVMNSPYSTLSALIAPITFAAFGWALRKVGFQWLKTVKGPDAAEESEQVPFLQEEDVIINVDGDQLVRGRRRMLMNWMVQ